MNFVESIVESMNYIRSHVIIAGRVQGVGYRYSTWEMANQLGLNGWVKNRSDGTVEAVFEGNDTTVEQMIQWCHQGPLHAKVTQVAVTAESPENLRGFKIT